MRIIPVAAGIIWRQEQFLAAKRPEGKAGAGYWEFPGGKQEAGETMPEALCRELGEELGIHTLPEHIRPWKSLVHEGFGQKVELHFMHVFSFTGEPAPREGQELRWVTRSEACSMPFLPVDIAIVEELNTMDIRLFLPA